MVAACRVDLAASPNFAGCFVATAAPSDARVDVVPYCVKACNASHSGEGVACLAGLADKCEAASDAGSSPLSVVATSCGNSSNSAAGGGAPASTACMDRCLTARKACEDVCTGGAACRDCRTSGGLDCSGHCPDAGLTGCVDCTAACGLTWSDCADAC
jgi:hypothetical protein